MAAAAIAEGAGATLSSGQAASTTSAAAKTSSAAQTGQAVGGAVSSVSQYSPLAHIIGFAQAKKSRKLTKKTFDLTFYENNRRWGMEWALQEWATRKGIALEEAQFLYQQKMGQAGLEMEQAQVGSSLRSEAQARGQAEETMRWAREDRAKASRMGKAYSRGIISGLFGGKK